MKGPWLYLAPRSNETSRANFLATLKNGYPANEVTQFLTPGEVNALGDKSEYYIWGNQKGKFGSWKKMSLGDYVAFYAKGEFVYVGRCILKKHSVELARNLWGNVPKKDFTWEYTFFVDSIRPIKIPLEVVIDLGDYNTNMRVQGFMPFKEVGMQRVLEAYGSLTAFFDAYSSGIRGKDFLTLEKISEDKKLSGPELEGFDNILRNKDLDVVLKDFEQRNIGKSPDVINRKISVIKRNQTLVRHMKERFENKCQICGWSFLKKNGEYYSELAHIKPISTKSVGVDLPSNMIVLCPNHHKMLDLGNLEIISAKNYREESEVKRLLKPLL